MAIITFSKATAFPTMPFPTAPLRDLLITHLSGYKWQCGEHDRGGKTEIGRFHGHMLISGRSFDTIVFTELRAIDAVLPGAAPPHLWHLNVGAPTTEIDHVADRVTLIICTTLMSADELDSRCQLHPGGNWLTAQDLAFVLTRVLAGEPLSLATGSVTQSAGAQPRAPIPTTPIAADPGERAERIIDDALQSIIDEGEAPSLRKIRSIIANNGSSEMRPPLTDVVATHEAEAAPGAPGATPAPLQRRPGGFGRKGL